MNPADRLAFYVVSNETYFIGAAALVNSLRVVGHDEPIYLCDCGLTAKQRALVAPHVRLVDAPTDVPPWLLKTVAPLAHPADVMVLIDADMIATRRLDDLAAIAQAGRIVAVRNDRERFVPEWGELLGLGPVRRRPYVSSGLVGLPNGLGGEVLGLMSERQSAVDFEQTFWRRNVRDYPFLYADQCILNAILMSPRVEASATVALDHRLAPTPPYRGLGIADEASLRCAYDDGTEPYVVHQFARKPWLQPVFHGVYSKLLVSLLAREDVAVRIPSSAIPRRLRQGAMAAATRVGVSAYDTGRWHLGERLPQAVGNRVEDARRRITGRL